MLLRPVHTRHRGATVVEFALVLPFLMFLFVIAIDYARVFYFSVILENCARNGAYYASNYPNANYLYNDIYGYKNLDEAVYKDAADLVHAGKSEHNPKYTLSYGETADGAFGAEPMASGYVKVTMSWTFRTITQFPGVPGQMNLQRSVTMKMAPPLPQFATAAPSAHAP